VQDVERASREVHVLTPTQYEASLRKRNLEEDKNAGLVFAQSEEQEKEKEWEERQRAVVKVMRIFGSARQGD
jgi:predicted nucleotidyltransferase